MLFFSVLSMQCESEFAAAYVAEEIIAACRLLLEASKARHTAAQAAQAQTPRVIKPAPKSPAADLLRQSHDILRSIMDVPEDASFWQIKTKPAAERGNGLYYTCCSNLGKCVCV